MNNNYFDEKKETKSNKKHVVFLFYRKNLKGYKSIEYVYRSMYYHRQKIKQVSVLYKKEQEYALGSIQYLIVTTVLSLPL